MLLVLSTIPSPLAGLAYIVIFGLGSVGGMMTMSVLLGLPLALAAGLITRAEGWLQTCAAVGSVAVGLLLAWEVTAQTRMPL